MKVKRYFHFFIYFFPSFLNNIFDCKIYNNKLYGLKLIIKFIINLKIIYTNLMKITMKELKYLFTIILPVYIYNDEEFLF